VKLILDKYEEYEVSCKAARAKLQQDLPEADEPSHAIAGVKTLIEGVNRRKQAGPWNVWTEEAKARVAPDGNTLAAIIEKYGCS
jgi:hypothetical protein